MVNPATKAAMIAAFNALMSNVDDRIQGNAGNTPFIEALGTTHDIERSGPITRVISRPAGNQTLNFTAAGYTEDSCVQIAFYLGSGQTVTIASNANIQVKAPAGTNEPSHQIQGPIRVAAQMKRTANGWNLYI